MRVTRQSHFGPVVEPGTSQGTIIHAEAGDADDVQRHISRGTQPSDVAGVGWDLGFYEYDREHRS